MTRTRLRAVVAVADPGLNGSPAAERVNGTQPGLSKQIKQLEDELGFLLFTRGARSLEGITPAGAKVIEHARLLLIQANNIKALAANLRQVHDGELRIATTHTQARYALPPALAAFNRQYPTVAVHLNPGTDAESLAMLDRDEAELAIISSAGTQPPSGYVALPLYRWDRIILVKPDHPLAHRTQALRLRELAQYPLVSYESSVDPESSLRRTFSSEGLAVNLAMTARDADLIKTYVRAGFGVGVLAEMAQSAEDGDLVRIEAAGLLPQCTCWALLRKDRILRDYTLSLLRRLLPWLHGNELQRLLRGVQAAPSMPPPHWRDQHTPGGIGEFEI